MPRYPRFTGQELIRVLLRNGFQVVRIKGSHHRLRHADGRVTTVPVHRGEVIGPGLVRKILRDAKINLEDV
jgi:predicted RNA binding protein YcfA (HicA-like mRNA interferase family)